MDIHKSLQTTTLEIYIIKLCHSNPLQKVMYVCVCNENGERKQSIQQMKKQERLLLHHKKYALQNTKSKG